MELKKIITSKELRSYSDLEKDGHRAFMVLPRKIRVSIMNQYCKECGEFLYKPSDNLQYLILNENHVCHQNKEKETSKDN